VVTWGDDEFGKMGGDSSAVAAQLKSGVVSFANIYTDDDYTDTNHFLTGKVSFSGRATEGQILTAGNTLKDADGLGDITYQWQYKTTVIGTGEKYTLKASDVGHQLTLTASYTDKTGRAERVISTASGMVGVEKKGTALADTLSGKAGDDILSGGKGNDTLNGGKGKDALQVGRR
jgi:Ca2+-binding RTX toxin-like protein